MAAKISVLGLILSPYPYLGSTMVRFPLMNVKGVRRTAPATPGLFTEKLQNYRGTEAPSYRVTELQSYRVTQLNSYQVSDLQS